MPFGKYAAAGWVLAPIPPGAKKPVNKGWNHRAAGITDPDVAEELPGAGLMHAYSQTACLDIDDFPLAVEWCELRGIDLQALWDDADAVRIISGRAGRGKLLYRLPLPMVSKQISLPAGPPGKDGKPTDKAVIDFRCATRGKLSMQDVLPPSLHPDTGRPYEWLYDTAITHWSTPPLLPESVRAVWASVIGPATAAPRQGASPTGARAEDIRHALANKDPDCARGTWVKILAAIHHETQGSEEGLALVDEWSATGTKYTGFDDVRVRWESFSLEHADPATLAGISAPMATEDDFAPVEQAAPAEPVKPEHAVAAAVAEAEEQSEENTRTRQSAEALLVKSLVYVREADLYYDVDRHEFLKSDHAIQHTWTNRMPRVQTMGGGVTSLNPVELLKISKKRRDVYAPAFNPSKGQFFDHEGKTYVNEFSGGLAEPLEPTADERRRLMELFNRIPDPVMRDWLLKFYAHAVQKPGVKIRAMPILWSHVMGNGKGTLLQTIPTLMFTDRYSASITNAMLAEPYNGYLVGKWFGHFTEMHADSRGDKNAIMNKIFPWISDDILPINIKFGAAYPTANFMFYTGASNHEDVVKIGVYDRRFAIGSMNNVPIMTPEENRRYYAEFLLQPRAAGVLRHFFLNYPLGEFNPNVAPPVTEAKLEMARQSMSHEVQVILEALENYEDAFEADVVSTGQIQSFLKDAAPRNILTPQKMGLMLGQAPLRFVGRRPNIQEGDLRKKVGLWIVRNHDQWKDADDRQLLQYWQNKSDPLTL